MIYDCPTVRATAPRIPLGMTCHRDTKLGARLRCGSEETLAGGAYQHQDADDDGGPQRPAEGRAGARGRRAGRHPVPGVVEVTGGDRLGADVVQNLKGTPCRL